MALRSKSRQDALLAGCLLLLLLGHVSPWHLDAESGTDDETCLLPSRRGRCKAFIRQWYHDRFTKTCKRFIWGGCGGNGNNFQSKEECEQACNVIKTDETCLLPSDSGFCKAIIPRWYHDQVTKTCKEFNWGGCGGNDNNFESEEDCEQACNVVKENSDRCLLPSDEGLCKASIPRWYYNKYRKTCQKFIWGGCGGNDNNFQRKKECEQACPVIKRRSKYQYEY